MNPIGRARNENVVSFNPKAVTIPYTSIPHQRNVYVLEDPEGVTGTTGVTGIAISLLECDSTYPYDRRNKSLSQNQSGEQLLGLDGSILLGLNGFPLEEVGE